jgi:hypothetical protein
VAPEDGYLGPNATADFDGPNIENNRNGALPADIRHTFKILASKDWALSPTQHIGTGVSLKARSGGATSYLAADPFTYEMESYLAQRGSGPRLPWEFGADVQLSYRITAFKGISFSATCDIFNILNLQAVESIDQEYSTGGAIAVQGFNNTADLDKVAPGKNYDYPNPVKGQPVQTIEKKPSFGQPTGYQDPRTVRFGVRGEF